MPTDWGYFNAAQDQDLARTLAQRDAQQRLVLQILQDEQARKMEERRIALAEQNAADNKAYRDASLASLDEDRRGRGEDRERNRELQAEARFQGRLKLLRPGSIVRANERGEFEKFGAAGLLKPHAADEHAPEEHAEFTGTADHANEQAKLEAAAERMKIEERYKQILGEVAQGKLDVAQALAAIAQQKQAEGPRARFAVQQTQDGRVFRVNLETGEAMPIELGGPAKGAMKTPEQIAAEAEAREKGKAAGKPKEKRFVADLIDGLTGGGNQPTAPAASVPATGGTVKMRAPDGRTLMVPASEVAAMEKLGAKRVQ